MPLVGLRREAIADREGHLAFFPLFRRQNAHLSNRLRLHGHGSDSDGQSSSHHAHGARTYKLDDLD